MNQNRQDALLDAVRNELFTCVVGDVMDTMGHRHQFLPPHLRPLTESMRVIGRAKTVLEADCHGRRVAHEDRDHAFGVMFDALDSMQAGEVYICTGSSPNYACWGELMSTAALHRGAVGAVIEGYSRDTEGVRTLKFPTFSMGCYGQDQGMRGRVIDYDCPIEFSNKVLVQPGENKVKKLIQQGMPTRQVWDEYGIM